VGSDLHLDYNLERKYFKEKKMRPRKYRQINFEPGVTFFKPRGIPMRELSIVSLSAEELEAIRLKNVIALDQVNAAKEMKTSQSTYQRILASGYKKIADALVNGKAIRIIEAEGKRKNE
jgi:predicted DNA-binding protein (UPF0251 family)